MSKRSIGLALVLSMVMVMAFAGIAMAAQIKLDAQGTDTKGSYLPTPKEFTADGNSLYPNEIYLPNEGTPANYRIHSNYTKNTDACAACHATHTAVGASLLQWANVYEACMACHDGTVTTTYNVKGGEIGATGTRTFGGMFGDGTENSWSNHNVAGAVEISAAPGGTSTANANEVDPVHDGATAAWAVEFGCQSCHSPHGQGANSRILSADPNGQSWEKYNAGTTKAVPLTLISGQDYKTTYTYAYDDDGVLQTGTADYFWIKGYPYSSKTKIYADGASVSTSAYPYTIDNTDGVTTVIKFTGAVPAGVLTADFVPAMRVKMTVGDYLQGTETVAHVSGLNDFCGACHTDYNTADEALLGKSSGSELNGEYTEAYRHKVGFSQSYRASTFAANGLKMPLESGNMTCETCHFAHGTTKEYWNATQSVNNAYRPGGVAGDWGDEIAGSSALKRLPNMGTCEACHDKKAGNEGYSPEQAPVVGTSVTSTGATFIGSTACGTCHASHKTGWQDTLHSKMIGGTDGDVSDEIVPAALGTGDSWNGLATIIANRGAINAKPSDVKWTVGSKWKQRYIVEDAVYGLTFLNKQWNIKFQVWETYGNGAPWDQMCVTCHATGYQINSISTTGDATTGNVTAIDHSYAEVNVGCEACHGPGSNHQKAPSNTNIKNPAKQSFTDQAKACGYCHIRGQSDNIWTDKVKTAGNWDSGRKLFRREDVPAPLGETFIPFENMDYENWGHYPGIGGAITLEQAAENTNAAVTVGGYVYDEAKGMVYDDSKDPAGRYVEKKHHQQYQGFLQSRHLTQNVLTCATCHSSHSRNSSKEQLKLTGAQTCGSCHGSVVTSGAYNIPANPSIAAFMPGTGGTAGTTSADYIGVRTHVFSPEAPNWTTSNFTFKTPDVANP